MATTRWWVIDHGDAGMRVFSLSADGGLILRHDDTNTRVEVASLLEKLITDPYYVEVDEAYALSLVPEGR